MRTFGFVDLRDPAAAWTPVFPRSELSTREISEAIIKFLQEIPGGIEGVLRTYEPEPVIWKIPQTYVGSFKGVELQACGSKVLTGTIEDYREHFHNIVSEYYRSGWSTKLRHIITKAVGRDTMKAGLIDTDDKSCGPSIGLLRLACEYLSIVSTRFGPLVVEDTSYFIAVKGHAPVGIIRGILHIPEAGIDIEVSEEELSKVLYPERGYVICAEYGAYDRTATWLMKHSNIPWAHEAITALSVLKLQFKPMQEFEFEQRLVFADKELAEVIAKFAVLRQEFSDEALQVLRDNFYALECETIEAYQKTYEAIVPKFMDRAAFMRIFGRPPQLTTREVELKRQTKRLNQGFERFVSWFLQQQHKYRRYECQ